jgi:hypothetical protein
MAAERQKIWRWEHRGVTPDRVSQLALATELDVPVRQLNAQRWPVWLPTVEPRSCQAEIASLRQQLATAQAALAATQSNSARPHHLIYRSA